MTQVVETSTPAPQAEERWTDLALEPLSGCWALPQATARGMSRQVAAVHSRA